MLACYLIKHKKMTGSEALLEIRRLRPGSVETNEQEKAILQYHYSLKNKKN